MKLDGPAQTFQDSDFPNAVHPTGWFQIGWSLAVGYEAEYTRAFRNWSLQFYPQPALVTTGLEVARGGDL